MRPLVIAVALSQGTIPLSARGWVHHSLGRSVVERALVTGGTKGSAQRSFEHSRVTAFALPRPRSASEMAELVVQADVSTVSGVAAVVGRVKDVFGGIDVLVHNVGGSSAPAGGFSVLGEADWQRALDVNLLAAVRLDRAFVPGMIERSSERV
jgi:NAD(P)-dependent dehydrogenase (short-subunit alcohol dehydrogenase family)